MEKTCLDQSLYGLTNTGAEISMRDPNRGLNGMVPAIIRGEAEMTSLDIPDALIALATLAGDIKIIGPSVLTQLMGSGFRKDSPQLRDEFNQFFRDSVENGTYRKLVEKYYPSVFLYLEVFSMNYNPNC